MRLAPRRAWRQRRLCLKTILPFHRYRRRLDPSRMVFRADRAPPAPADSTLPARPGLTPQGPEPRDCPREPRQLAKSPCLLSLATEMNGRRKQIRKPPPIAPKVKAATHVLPEDVLKKLAATATYEGSVQHKDADSFSGAPKPRRGAMHAGASDERPDCMLCPSKWAHHKSAATQLLRIAIERGQFRANDGSSLPRYVWARDPSDPSIVYEARLLSHPPTGYKAYPLTAQQVRMLEIPV